MRSVRRWLPISDILPKAVAWIIALALLVVGYMFEWELRELSNYHRVHLYLNRQDRESYSWNWMKPIRLRLKGSIPFTVSLPNNKRQPTIMNKEMTTLSYKYHQQFLNYERHCCNTDVFANQFSLFSHYPPFSDVVFPPLPLSTLFSSPFHCTLQNGYLSLPT